MTWRYHIATWWHRTRAATACIAVVLCTHNAIATEAGAPSSLEQKILVALRGEKYVSAREQAEQLLTKQKSSVIALFAMSQVYQHADTNLPRALYFVREAERALLRQARAEDDYYRHWHRKLLLAQVEILGWMDRRSEQLAVLDKHDRTFGTKLTLKRVWPLMKLHRFAEATKIAKQAIVSADPGERLSGYNSLLSIEFERERPGAAYAVARQALPATQERSCVLDHNVAEAALAVFEFSEAERLALKSIQAPLKDCPSTAHWLLANLYLLQADFSRAIAAVKEAREQAVVPSYREQFEMFITAWLVRLLHALGEFDQSLKLAERVLRAPNREGMTSYSSALQEAVYTIDYYAALKARVEQVRERASARSWREQLSLWPALFSLRIRAWRARRHASKLLSSVSALRSLLRPYVKPFPAWNMPLIAEIVGGAIVQRVVGQMRARLASDDTHTEGYWDAIQTGVAHRKSRYGDVMRYAQRALRRLPTEEVLLRARVESWLANAAYERGTTKTARKYFDAVLNRWPTVLRLESLRVPVTIRNDGNKLSRAVSERLKESRRLRPDDQRLGFTVSVAIRAERVETCLSGTRGRRYACVTTDRNQPTGTSVATAAVDTFHDKIFVPLIDLTQQDIRSLDGSAVRGRADVVLEEVFGR